MTALVLLVLVIVGVFAVIPKEDSGFAVFLMALSFGVLFLFSMKGLG